MLDYQIKEMYEDMEMYLIRSMKRNLKRHLLEEDAIGFKYPQWQVMKLKELKRYQRQNKEIIGSNTKGFSEEVARYLKNELEEGSYNVLKQYKEAMGDKYKANKRLNNSFFKINDKKVNSLIKSVNNDLTNANNAILRMTNDQYRQVIFKSEFYRANGVLTTKQAIDMANRDFLRRGLNVVEYKDGKRVNIASYSQMAVRTAGQRAMLMGEGDARQKLGTHLIKISSHGTSCELCQDWQGKILIDDVYGGGSSKDGNYTLLSEAMKQGLFHPNCRHGVITYFDGADDTSDIDASYADGKDGSESNAQYQDDMNYINRKIKEYTRLEEGSLDEGNVKTYKDKRKEWENKKIELEAKTQDTVVNGKNIVGEFKRRSDRFDYEIEDVINYQGFDGKPKVVSSEEFEKAMKESNFYAERTYSANSKEVLEEYRNQLYNDKWYVDCSAGGSQYGQGMYCAASYDITDTKKIDGIGLEMKHYQALNKEKGNPFYYTEGITLDKSAKILTIPKNEDDTYVKQVYQNQYLLKFANKEQLPEVKKYVEIKNKIAELTAIDGVYEDENLHKKLMDLVQESRDAYKNGSFKDLITASQKETYSRDVGSLAVEMGYDIINALGHGESGSYTVILNRTKVIFRKGGSLYGN